MADKTARCFRCTGHHLQAALVLVVSPGHQEHRLCVECAARPDTPAWLEWAWGPERGGVRDHVLQLAS